ncbi:hypothetical protein AB4Z01_00980 [Inquilinus sp. YAF38]|uniref:hypothetical protein n=1 Tax=Inquilinus sp. YAF38 TaxID=3233084 RepID=UPI003F91AEAB
MSKAKFDLSACDREPIHIPGSIQPHGVLLVVDAETLDIPADRCRASWQAWTHVPGAP